MITDSERQIAITHENAERYAALSRELQARFETLAVMTARYPVEVEYKGFRFVFDRPVDIRRVIDVIDERLKEYRHPVPVSPPPQERA